MRWCDTKIWFKNDGSIKLLIYANSVVAGKITIGDHAVIGACSFVNTDVPANAVYAGVPAKMISRGVEDR